MSRARFPAWMLVVLLVVVPIVELAVLIQVGQVIGVGWTVVLLIVDSVIGAWLLRREGSRAWNALTQALSSGRMPAREIADGALIVLGGALMLTPGFVSDLFGIGLILPITRPLARGVLTRVVARRLGAQASYPRADRRAGPTPQNPRPGAGTVVEGSVVDRADPPQS